MNNSQSKQRGRKRYWPQEEPFVTIGFRIPKSLHDQLLTRAQKGFRSMNAELTWTLAKEFGIGPKVQPSCEDQPERKATMLMTEVANLTDSAVPPETQDA